MREKVGEEQDGTGRDTSKRYRRKLLEINLG